MDILFLTKISKHGVAALYVVNCMRSTRGKFLIREGELPVNDCEKTLSEEEKQTIDAVCAVLSSRTGNELSIRTHAESPWKIARGDLPPSAPCSTIISKKTIQEYYAANPIVRESMQKQVPTPNTFI